MKIKLNDLIKWMGISFAIKVKTCYQQNKIKKIADILELYKLHSAFGGRTSQKIRRRIIEETGG